MGTLTHTGKVSSTLKVRSRPTGFFVGSGLSSPHIGPALQVAN